MTSSSDEHGQDPTSPEQGQPEPAPGPYGSPPGQPAGPPWGSPGEYPSPGQFGPPPSQAPPTGPGQSPADPGQYRPPPGAPPSPGQYPGAGQYPGVGQYGPGPAPYGAPPAYGPGGYAPVPPPKTGMPRWAKVLIGAVGAVVVIVVVLIVVAVVFVNHTTKDAEKVSGAFVADIQKNNVNAAYALTSPAFRSTTTKSTFTAFVHRVSPLLQGKSHVTGHAISKGTGHPDEVGVVYEIDTSAGDKYARVVLQNDSPWQVRGVQTSNTPLNVNSGS